MLKKPIKSFPNPQSSGKKSCLNFRNCCLSCLGLIVVFVVVFLIIIALSGVIRIPFLSPIFYGDGPNPTRVISQQDVSLQFISDLFKTTANQNKSEVIISEEVLTYYINYYANTRNRVLVPENERTSGSQLAIEDGYGELFLKRAGSKVVVTAWISVDNDRFVIRKFKIGKLRIPVFLANWYLSTFIDSNRLSFFGLQSIKIAKGQLHLIIDPQFFKEETEGKIPPLPFPN